MPPLGTHEAYCTSGERHLTCIKDFTLLKAFILNKKLRYLVTIIFVLFLLFFVKNLLITITDANDIFALITACPGQQRQLNRTQHKHRFITVKFTLSHQSLLHEPARRSNYVVSPTFSISGVYSMA